MFLGNAVFDSVTRDAELRSRLHGLEAAGPSHPGAFEPVKYRSCPGCRNLMNRVNYGRISGVVIDVCRKDGIWFDRGELSAIVAFLEGGGSERVRRREHESIRQEMADLEAARSRGATAAGFQLEPEMDTEAGGGMLFLLSALFGKR